MIDFRFPARSLRSLVCSFAALPLFHPLLGQEQIDKADARGKGSAAVGSLSVRVRVTRTAPEQDSVRINWRHGGEGLGGTVVRGNFATPGKLPQVPVGDWTEWLP